MRTVFLASFLRDVKKLRDAKMQRNVAGAIANVEGATAVEEVSSLKRLSGQRDYLEFGWVTGELGC